MEQARQEVVRLQLNRRQKPEVSVDKIKRIRKIRRNTKDTMLLRRKNWKKKGKNNKKKRQKDFDKKQEVRYKELKNP